MHTLQDEIDSSINHMVKGQKVKLSPALAMMLNGLSQYQYRSDDKVAQMLNGLHLLKIYREEEIDEEEDVDVDDVDKPIPLDFAKYCNLEYLGVKNVLCGVDLMTSSIHATLVKLSFSGVYIQSVAETMGLTGDNPKSWSSLKVLKLKMCQLNELEDIFDKESFPELRLLDVSHNHIKKIKRIGERPLDVLHADNNEIRVVSCRQVRTLSVITLDNNRIKNLNGLKGYTIYSVKNNLIDRHPSIFQVFNKMFNIEEIYLEGNPTAQIPNYKIEMAKVIPSLQLGLPCSLDSKPFTMEEQISAFSENTSKSNETFYDDEDDFDFSQFDHLRTRTMTESTESSIKHGMPRNMKLRAELTRKSSRSDFRIEEISKEEIGKEQKRMECQSYVISKLNILKKKSSEDPAKVIEADRFIRKIRRIIEGMEDPLVTDKFLEEERKRKEHEEEEKNTKKKDAGWSGAGLTKHKKEAESSGFLSKEKVIEIRFDDFENAIPVPLLYDIIKTAVSEKRTLKIRFVSAKKKWDGVMNITIPLDFPAAFTFLQVTNATLQDIVDAEQDKMDFLPKCDISPENLSVIREYFDKSQSDKSAGLSAKELLLTKKFEPSAIEEHPDIKKIVTLTLEQDEVDRPALDGINDMLAQI